MKTSLLAIACMLFILLADCGYANPYFEDGECSRVVSLDSR